MQRDRVAMEKVEWDDVQGVVLSGYPRLPYSAFVLWRFRPQRVAAARQWLSGLAGRLMRAGDVGGELESIVPSISINSLKRAGPRDLRAINLALTARGLEQLEVGDKALKSFSVEFLEGMAPKPDQLGEIPRRTNALGDLGESSPASWEWGGWANGELDGLLMLFAADTEALRSLVDDEIKAMAEAAEPIIVASPGGGDPRLLQGRLYEDRKEHFGYTDGISQPVIEGSPRSQRRGEYTEEDKRIHFVKPGEFLFGYNNERRMRAAGGDPADLRRNGSYLVLRQLEQDVPGFDDFVSKAAALLRGEEDTGEKKEWIASHLVGRGSDGTALACPAINSRNSDDPLARHKSGNDFLFHHQDRFGLKCPIGSHIRRANPRDTKGPDPDTALRLSKMHRIIRRSRMYGEKFDPAKPGSDKSKRGILFVCLNADIAGQFEMIQHSWLNNRHFGDLYVGTDPLGHSAADGGTIVIQRQPTNLVLERPKPFVRVRGGGYFFLPGIAAVRRLGEMGAVPEARRA